MPYKIVKPSRFLLVLLLGVFVLSACGDQVTATPASQPTTAASKKLRIGFVSDVGRINDHGYQQDAWEGLLQVQQNLGAEVKYIETKDAKDFSTNINEFVSAKEDIIVTIGPFISEATYNAAKANPDILFIGVDQPQPADKQLKNLASLVFEEDKAGFLAGILAAGMSQQGKVGAILGPQEIPALARFGEGFKAGAAYLDANNPALVKSGHTSVTLVYHPNGTNAFTDQAWGVQQAQTLAGAKADVIFGAAGATGSAGIEVGATQGVYVIGVDSDQYFTLPKAAPRLLSSATKMVGAGLVKFITAIQQGKFTPGNITGPVGLAPFHDTDSQIPQSLKDVLQKVNTGLNNGTLQTGVQIK